MGSIFRNHYRDAIEVAIGTQIAAQGDSQTMKQYVKQLEGLSKTGLAPRGNDIAVLKQLLGKKGGI